MNKKVMAGAAALALLLLGGCAAPSERPGQATPSPTPTSSETAPATTPSPTPSVTTESVAPASPTPSAPAETATPTPTTTPTTATATPPLVNNWPELLSGYPEVAADLLKAGLAIEDVAAQAAIRTGAGQVPIATVKVAFGTSSGGDLVSTGGCKASSGGTCPTDTVEGLLPLVQEQDKEPYRDFGSGLLIVFIDNKPVVLQDLTLKKR